MNDTPPTTANVQAVLNEHPFSRFQWIIFSLWFFLFFIDCFF